MRGMRGRINGEVGWLSIHPCRGLRNSGIDGAYADMVDTEERKMKEREQALKEQEKQEQAAHKHKDNEHHSKKKTHKDEKDGGGDKKDK